MFFYIYNLVLYVELYLNLNKFEVICSNLTILVEGHQVLAIDNGFIHVKCSRLYETFRKYNKTIYKYNEMNWNDLKI